MRTEDRYFLEYTDYSQQQVNGKLVTTTQAEDPSLYKYRAQREDLREYAKKDNLEITGIAMKQDGSLYSGIFDSHGTLYTFVLSSLGTRIQKTEDQGGAWRVYNEISDQEHQENLYLRREQSQDDIDQLNAEFNFSLKDCLTDLFKAEGEKRGHKGYYRFDPRSGKTVFVKPKNPKPEHTEKPLWEMTKEEIEAIPTGEQIYTVYPADSDIFSYRSIPVEVSRGGVIFNESFFDFTPEERKDLLQMAVGKAYMNLGSYSLHNIYKELFESPEYMKFIDENLLPGRTFNNRWHLAGRTPDIGAAIFAWMQRDPEEVHKLYPKTFQEIAEQAESKGVHLNPKVEEVLERGKQEKKAEEAREREGILETARERVKSTEERHAKERGLQTSTLDPRRKVPLTGEEITPIALLPVNPFPKDTQELEYKGYEHVLKTSPKSFYELRKVTHDFVRDTFEGTEEELSHQTQAYLDLFISNYTISMPSGQGTDPLLAEVLPNQKINIDRLHQALQTPLTKLTYSDNTDVNAKVYEEDQYPYEAQKVIREEFDALLAGFGLRNRDVVFNPVGASQFRVVKNFAKDADIAIATHDYQGVIRILSDRANTLKHAIHTLYLNNKDTRVAYTALSSKEIHEVSTMIHECLHGHSVAMSEGGGIASLVEEVSTEVAARSLTRQFLKDHTFHHDLEDAQPLTGADYDHRGSYGSWIGAVNSSISEELHKQIGHPYNGKDDRNHISNREVFHAMLVPASVALKSHPDELEDIPLGQLSRWDTPTGKRKKRRSGLEFLDLFIDKMPIKEVLQRNFIDVRESMSQKNPKKYPSSLDIPDEVVDKEIQKRVELCKAGIKASIRKKKDELAAADVKNRALK